MLLNRKKKKKTINALYTCFETFGRWVLLKRGQELNILLTSGYQFAKTVEIPSRFKVRSSLFFALFQDVSTTLQYITRKEKKEQQITNDER